MKKVLKILEFDRILERMSEYTESEPVRKRIMRLEPYATVKEAAAAQRETTEGRAVYRGAERHPAAHLRRGVL